MPPNAKENAAIVDTLATVNVRDLVDPKASAQSSADTAALSASEEYWVWNTPSELLQREKKFSKEEQQARTKVKLITRGPEGERDHISLSVERIQSNVVAFRPKEQIRYVAAIESDNFWDWRRQVEAPHVKSSENPSDEYWHWDPKPTNTSAPKTASDLYWSW